MSSPSRSRSPTTSVSPSTRRPLRQRPARWLALWGGILPLLVAEFIVWVGFGALLPVMPLYFTDRGVDVQTLGIVVAAWPATRLIGEPIFGWIADRVPRVPLMVVGLLIGGVSIGLSLVVASAGAFLALRALAGLGAAIYDPAARGYVTDATPAVRRGEAFGLYGAAQMGGLMLGPAIGGLGGALFGGVEFVFVFGSVASLLAIIPILLRVREGPRARPGTVPPVVEGFGDFRVESPSVAEAAARALQPNRGASGPSGFRNPWLLAAIVINAGGYFAGGVYEVIWSLFLEGRGAGLELIGLTFATFGLPVLLLAPWFGRQIDRRGPFGFVVAGSLMMAAASATYPSLPENLFVIPVILVEATGFAMLGPALFAIVARGSPAGRSSTAQGLFGASGTLGTILASLLTGYLAATDITWPFYAGAVAIAGLLLVGLAVGGRAIRESPALAGAAAGAPIT